MLSKDRNHSHFSRYRLHVKRSPDHRSRVSRNQFIAMAMSSLLQLLCVSVAVVALSCGLNAPPVYAASGDELELTAWQLQSSAHTTATGGQLSTPGWSPTPPEAAWYNITGPATVLAGLVQAGVYVDPFYSQNLADIPTGGCGRGKEGVLVSVAQLTQRFWFVRSIPCAMVVSHTVHDSRQWSRPCEAAV